MAVFEITAPDGSVYQITAPDEGAAMSAFNSMLGGQPAPPAPAAPQAPPQSEPIMQAASGFNEGLYGLLGLPGDVSNFAAEKMGFGRPFMGGSDIKGAADNFIYSAPPGDTAVDRIARNVGQVAGGSVVPMAGLAARGNALMQGAQRGRGILSGAVDDAASFAASNPARFATMEGVAAAGGGIAGGVTAEVTDNPYAKMAAEVVGGMGAGMLAAPVAKSGAPASRADAMINDRLAQDGGVDLADVPPGARLVDMAGENTARFAGAVKRAPGEGKNILEQSADDVAAGERQAILGDTRDVLGDAGESYMTRLDQVSAQREAQAEPNFKASRAAQVDLTPEMEAILATPSGAKAVRDAQKAMDDVVGGGRFYDDDITRGNAPGDPEIEAELASIRDEVGGFFSRYDDLGKSLTAMKKRPARAAVRAVGGIDPSSPLARELRSRDITPRTFPAMFKRGGRGALDNIPASEHPDMQAMYGAQSDGYIRQDDWIDALERELKGDPVRGDDVGAMEREFAEMDANFEEMSRLRDEYPDRAAAPEKKQITMQGLHEVGIKLGKEIEAERASRSPDNIKIDRLTTLKDNFYAQIDAQNEDFGLARRVFETDSNLMDSFVSGRKFARDDVEVTAKAFDKMNSAEKDAYRLGVAREVSKRADTMGGRSSLMRDEGLRDKLAAVMSDREAELFMRRLDFRLKQRKTNTKIRGGSPTAENQAEDLAFQEGAALAADLDLASSVLRGGVKGAVIEAVNRYSGAVWNGYIRGLRGEVGKAAAARLTMPPKDALEALRRSAVKANAAATSRGDAKKALAITRSGAFREPTEEGRTGR